MFGGSRKSCRRKTCRRKTLRGGNPIMGGPGRSGGSDFSKGSSGSFKFGGRKRTCRRKTCHRGGRMREEQIRAALAHNHAAGIPRYRAR